MTSTVSVIVCTRNRPDDLEACLGSLAAQTRLPDEVLVVDASDDDEPRRRVEAWASRAPIEDVRVVAAAPGLTRQRNIGVAASRGDIVTFLDDDVVLDPAYLRRVLDVFEADRDVAGVEGAVAMEPLRGRRRMVNAFRQLFLMNSLGPRRGVKRSGFVTYDPWPTGVRRVGSLVGCNMSYRRRVFDRFRFDEWFDGYGLCEDQDFSYRVGRIAKLVQTPAARLEHRVSPVARAGVPRLHEMTALNHWYFVRKNLPDTPLTWLAFLWSELGELLSVLKTGDRAAIAGKLRGYRRIIEMRRAGAVPAAVQEAS